MSGLRSVWICHGCEVLGADPVLEPECWNCGGPVTVTARTAGGPEHHMSGAITREGGCGAVPYMIGRSG